MDTWPSAILVSQGHNKVYHNILIAKYPNMVILFFMNIELGHTVGK